MQKIGAPLRSHLCPYRAFNVNCEDSVLFYPLNKQLYLTPDRVLSPAVDLTSSRQVDEIR